MGTDTEEKKDAETQEEEYDRLYDETTVEGEEKPEGDKDKEKDISDEDSPRKTPEPTPEPDPTPEPTVADLQKANADLQARLDNETKRRIDNQSFAQKNAAEVKRLNEVMAEHDKGKATDGELSDALAAVKKTIDAEYPDMGDVFDPILKHTQDLERRVAAMTAETAADKQARLDAQSKQEANAKSVENYRANVLPKVQDKHPDFVQVINTPEFSTWVKTQSESTQHAYHTSQSPEDAIELMTKFKTYQGSDEAKAALETQQKINATKEAGMNSLRGGGGAPKFPDKSKDEKKSYNELWENGEDPKH